MQTTTDNLITVFMGAYKAYMPVSDFNAADLIVKAHPKGDVALIEFKTVYDNRAALAKHFA